MPIVPTVTIARPSFRYGGPALLVRPDPSNELCAMIPGLVGVAGIAIGESFPTRQPIPTGQAFLKPAPFRGVV